MAANSELLFEDVWERMRLLTGWKNYGELAGYLEIKQPSVSGAKKKGIIPIEWVLRVATGFKGSTDWLFFGEGPMRKGEAGGKREPTKGTPSPVKQAAWSDGDWENADVNIQQLLNMTAEILVSDTVYRPALAANIKAFRRSIDLEKTNQDMQTQINILENRLAALEQRLESPPKAANGD